MDSRHSSPPLDYSPRGITRPMSISTISMPPSYHNAPPQHPSQQPLTRLLFSTSPHLFTSATQHPFLRHAGLGTLSKPHLSSWLSQDRIYAQAYINFIGSLISRLHLPHHYITATNKTTSLRWRLLALLTDCLTNIRRELDLFDTTASQYGLKLDAASSHRNSSNAPFEPLPTTKQYEGLFRAFGSDPSMTLLEGLVVLWATETCYLHAWKYARSFWPEERSTNPDRAVDVGMIHRHNSSQSTSTSTVPPRRPVPSPSPSQHQQHHPSSAGASARNGISHRHNSYSSITHTATHIPGNNNTNTNNNNNNLASPPSPLQSPGPAAAADTSPTSLYGPSPSHAGPETPISETREVYDAPELVVSSRLSHRDLDGGALRDVFIPNWTSREFGVFVDEIGELMDELYVREEGWRRAEVFRAVWEHVCGIEGGFWPVV